MAITRRQFLQQSAGVAGAMAVGSGCALADPATPPVLVNHAGFTPMAGKICMLQGAQATPFSIVDARSQVEVYRGSLVPAAGDLGQYLVGAFHDFKTPGEYEIRAGASRSGPFAIHPNIYESAVAKSIRYFAKQRCGDSKTGHHAPCHLDDGTRADNHQHQDVTGGWHDACDLRRWVNATIYGMIGLSRVLDAGRWDRQQLLDELRWGNQYFCKMQEPDGYIMDYCGGDDGNRYTNNIIGDADDRVIHIDPCELSVQFQFVAAQASMARHTRDTDADYARGCIAAAERCLDWCVKNRSPGAATTLGAAVIACIQLHAVTTSNQLADLLSDYLRRLRSLQVTRESDPASAIHGFFRTARDRPEPLREIMHGNVPLLALCEALSHFPEHAEAKSWREMLALHVAYLLKMSERSAFGTIPFGLYEDADPGGNRRLGNYWYRWFMKTKDEQANAPWWWVGINAHLASNGVGLMRAAKSLGEPRLAQAGQRQLDWILGVNPFSASTVTDVGRDQPKVYVPGAFKPPTPQLSGGVMCGIGGSQIDEPSLDAGSWNTCEYWTPMVAYTMWLECEAGAVG